MLWVIRITKLLVRQYKPGYDHHLQGHTNSMRRRVRGLLRGLHHDRGWETDPRQFPQHSGRRWSEWRQLSRTPCSRWRRWTDRGLQRSRTVLLWEKVKIGLIVRNNLRLWYSVLNIILHRQVWVRAGGAGSKVRIFLHYFFQIMRISKFS